MADIVCPNCGSVGLDISIVASELRKEEGYLRRRFDCNACQTRFFTYEVPLSPEVAKRLDTTAGAQQLTWSELIERLLSGPTTG